VRGSWRVWITVAALFFLHFLLHLGLGLGRAAPDLLVVALLVGARRLRMGSGAALGFVFGILEDAFSVLSFGANTVSLTVVGAVGARSRDLFVGDSMLFMISYLFAGKWVRDLIFWMVSGDLRGPFGEMMLVQASLAALYAAAVGVIAMWVSGAWWESLR
jgi:rod shape-determining protein MreD